MNVDQHQEIMEKLGVIDTRTSVVETKVDDLRVKVGIQNGRVTESEKQINALRVQFAEMAGEKKGSQFTFGNVLAIITAVGAIAAFIFKH